MLIISMKDGQKWKPLLFLFVYPGNKYLVFVYYFIAFYLIRKKIKINNFPNASAFGCLVPLRIGERVLRETILLFGLHSKSAAEDGNKNKTKLRFI